MKKKSTLSTKKQARVEDAMKYGKEILKKILKMDYIKMILGLKDKKKHNLILKKHLQLIQQRRRKLKMIPQKTQMN